LNLQQKIMNFVQMKTKKKWKPNWKMQKNKWKHMVGY
jgi:hypothetical protein